RCTSSRPSVRYSHRRKLISARQRLQPSSQRVSSLLCSSFPLTCKRMSMSLAGPAIEAEEVPVMKSRQGYKGYVIVARSCELREGEFSAEFSVEEHAADGFMETEFYLPDTFPTQESAIEAAIQAGRQKIDMGFERGSEVVKD